MDSLANAVKVTLGPRGRNVILGKAFGSPTIIGKDAAMLRSEAVTRIEALQHAGLNRPTHEQELLDAIMTDDGTPRQAVRSDARAGFPDVEAICRSSRSRLAEAPAANNIERLDRRACVTAQDSRTVCDLSGAEMPRQYRNRLDVSVRFRTRQSCALEHSAAQRAAYAFGMRLESLKATCATAWVSGLHVSGAGP